MEVIINDCLVIHIGIYGSSTINELKFDKRIYLCLNYTMIMGNILYGRLQHKAGEHFADLFQRDGDLVHIIGVVQDYPDRDIILMDGYTWVKANWSYGARLL